MTIETTDCRRLSHDDHFAMLSADMDNVKFFRRRWRIACWIDFVTQSRSAAEFMINSGVFAKMQVWCARVPRPRRSVQLSPPLWRHVSPDRRAGCQPTRKSALYNVPRQTSGFPLPSEKIAGATLQPWRVLQNGNAPSHPRDRKNSSTNTSSLLMVALGRTPERNTGSLPTFGDFSRRICA